MFTRVTSACIWAAFQRRCWSGDPTPPLTPCRVDAAVVNWCRGSGRERIGGFGASFLRGRWRSSSLTSRGRRSCCRSSEAATQTCSRSIAGSCGRCGLVIAGSRWILPVTRSALPSAGPPTPLRRPEEPRPRWQKGRCGCGPGCTRVDQALRLGSGFLAECSGDSRSAELGCRTAGFVAG